MWNIAVLVSVTLGNILFGGIEGNPSMHKNSNSFSENQTSCSDDVVKKLELEILATYGKNGNKRPAVIIAGEKLNIRLKISGLSTENDGEANLIIESEIIGPDEKPVLRMPNEYIDGRSLLGGTAATPTLYFQTQRDVTPGKYCLQVKVTDKLAKESIQEKFVFEILPRSTFGAVNLGLFHDAEGRYPAGGNITVGETIYLLYSVTGYNTSKGRFQITNTIEALENAHVVSKPKVIAADQPLTFDPDTPLPIKYWFGANRSGKFLLRITVKDDAVNKEQVYEIPLLISPSPQADGILSK